MIRTPTRDLAQTFFTLIVLILLMGGSLYILWPFIPGLVWATMIVVSTWPLMLGLQRIFRGRRSLAAGTMVLAMLLVIILPLFVAVVSIAKNAVAIRQRVLTLQTADIPKPPAWVGKVPLVGEKVAQEWNAVIAEGAEGVRERLAPYTRQVFTWMSTKAGSIGMLGIHFLLTVALTGILYMRGEEALRGVIRFAERLNPRRGRDTVRLAGQAIRSVAMGIVVTALVQAVLGGIGLAVCGVPGSLVLTGVMFFLSITQLGTFPVLVPAVGWLYWSGHPGWGTTLLVITVFVFSLDNILRPFLIKRGADLPLLLIIAGVIGGMLAFGLVGLFVGPGLLAVAYALLNSWMADEPRTGEPVGGPGSAPDPLP